MVNICSTVFFRLYKAHCFESLKSVTSQTTHASDSTIKVPKHRVLFVLENVLLNMKMCNMINTDGTECHFLFHTTVVQIQQGLEVLLVCSVVGRVIYVSLFTFVVYKSAYMLMM